MLLKLVVVLGLVSIGLCEEDSMGKIAFCLCDNG